MNLKILKRLLKKAKTPKMLKPISLLKTIFFIYIYFLLACSCTDADFRDQQVISHNEMKATTLDFSNKSTSNEKEQNFLYEIDGFIPGGFAVESVRIKKEGKLEFSYELEYQFESGNKDFCSQLHLKILKNNEFVYDDKLTNLNYSSFVNQHDDLVLFISLENTNFKTEKYCDFNLVFNTKKNNDTIFHDREVLNNHISFSQTN